MIAAGALLAAAALWSAAGSGEDLGRTEFYADARAYFERPPATEAPAATRFGARAGIGVRLDRLLGPSWSLEADARASVRYRERDGRGETDSYLEIRRLALRGERLFGTRFLTLAAGRERLRDHRSWLLDDDFEVLRLGYDTTLLDLEAGVAGWLWEGRIGDRAGGDLGEDEPREAVGSGYAFAGLSFQWRYRHFVGARILAEDYRRPGDARPERVDRSEEAVAATDLGWLAVNARGEHETPRQFLEYDLNAAIVDGRWQAFVFDAERRPLATERRDAERALGYDLRLTSRLRDNRYAVGVGFAGGELGYVQPQATRNRDRALGMRRFHSYGEALSPRLGNIRITSLRAGVALTPRLWLEGVRHQYRQAEPRAEVLSDRVLVRANGDDPDLGSALDLVLSGRVRRDLELQLGVGRFQAGGAFDGSAHDPDGYRITAEVHVRW